MNTVDANKTRELLTSAKNVLITPSAPVDGDSIGSALALMLVLQRMGKNVTVVCTEEVPEPLRFVPFLSKIQTKLEASRDFVISLNTEGADVDHLKYEVEQGKLNIIITPKDGQFSGGDVSFAGGDANFDLLVTVDTGDLVQLGKLYEKKRALFGQIPVLNIDHHASNGKFGTYNFLNSTSPSTTAMLAPIMIEMEKEHGEQLIDDDVATLLLLGIITDTGSFQHSNTSPDAFEVAAELLERGARQQEIIKHIFKTKSLATLKLWGRVLSQIRYKKDAKLVYSTISLKDLEDTGATPDDSGGIIDELMSNAPNSEVVLLMKEKEPGFVSGSLRAPGNLADVSEIAQKLGGGGHKKAAGFRIRGKSLEEALTQATETITAYVQEKLGGTEPTQEKGPLFPGLAVKPETQKPQTSIPAPSPGGEDMLLEDFRKRNSNQDKGLDSNLEKDKEIEKKSAPFFQDADGQEKPAEPADAANPGESNKPATPGDDPTVGDVLSQLGQY